MTREQIPGQFSMFDQDTWYGKMFLAHSAATKERTSVVSSKKPQKYQKKMPQFLDLRGGKWNKAGCIVGNGWSIAWRLHDAQFWGVPQRRKRICLLADFNGDSAPKILFELFGEANESNENETELGFREESESKIQSLCDSLSRDIEQSEQKRKKTSSVVGECTNPTITFRKSAHPMNAKQGQGWEETEINDTLNVFDNSEGRTPTIVLENHPNDSRVKICEDNIFQTLSSRMGTGGGNVPMILESSKEPTIKVPTAEPHALSFGNGQLHDALSPSEEVSKTLNCMDDPAKIVTYGIDRAAFNQGKNAKFNFSVENELIGAQVAKGPGAVFQSVVRRLTPMECERLQGYPDGWTNIGEWTDSKGKKHREADSPRYKALGNSIALPFWRWLAERIVTQYDRQTTMASLFDGIGGFPLVFSEFGCEPIWASEIEEFPIAVTKLRFN